MGKKIIFEETGKFTKNQEKLCSEIAERIRKLRKSGCTVIAKQDTLCVYLNKEIKYSNLLNLGKSYSNRRPIPWLDAGSINDSGADDTEFFIDECLDDYDEEEY